MVGGGVSDGAERILSAGEVDMEIGPGEEMPQNTETAKLLQVVEGKEEVEMMDQLLSVAFDSSDEAWL
jgi:hypothetical protein